MPALVPLAELSNSKIDTRRYKKITRIPPLPIIIRGIVKCHFNPSSFVFFVIQIRAAARQEKRNIKQRAELL
jgi:hypothetical protein